MSFVRIAGTPSSSHPNVPMPPGPSRRRSRHVLRTVAERAAILRPHEGRARERDLVLEHAVGLGRMTAGLVHEQGEELGREDERRGRSAASGASSIASASSR